MQTSSPLRGEESFKTNGAAGQRPVAPAMLGDATGKYDERPLPILVELGGTQVADDTWFLAAGENGR